MDTFLNIANNSITLLTDLPGFPGARHFIIEQFGSIEENVFARIKCLDKIEGENGVPLSELSLLVISPHAIWPDYEIYLEASVAEALGLKSAEDAATLAIVHLKKPFEQSTVNLYSPIIVNIHTGLGDQIIPQDTDEEIKWRLQTPFPEVAVV
jgi:flagellar assembly factor FliW